MATIGGLLWYFVIAPNYPPFKYNVAHEVKGNEIYVTIENEGQSSDPLLVSLGYLNPRSDHNDNRASLVDSVCTSCTYGLMQLIAMPR